LHPNYSVWIIKLVHCLNDLQIQIFFLQGKIHTWKKPSLKGKGPDQLEGRKSHSDKIIRKLHEGDPGNDATIFPLPGGFLSWFFAWLLTYGAAWIDEAALGLDQPMRRLSSLHGNPLIGPLQKHPAVNFHPTKCKPLLPFRLKLLYNDYFGLF